MAGGTGNGLEEVQSSVEFIDLVKLDKWNLLEALKRPRCCWPQLGFVGSDLFILSGEQLPSQTIERFDLPSMTWQEDATLAKMLMKRSQSRAIFAKSVAFPDQCVV